MATGTAKTATTPVSIGAAQGFIAKQLGKTRWQIRVVDLSSALMMLVAAVLGYLFVLAIIDHWLVPLAWWGRWMACLALLSAVVAYIIIRVVPLIVRPINPIYAAKAIEEAEPALKNSLINFLSFRGDRGSLHQVVYSAMEQRAAADLHHVAIDTAVDRSPAIYAGAVLAAILALGAAYKILSPKDPLPSVSRVAVPWANIERPTRVLIHDVQPGDATVFQGDQVAVSAVVEGTAKQVTLYYSTTDGELDNQPISMTLDTSGTRYACRLPEASDGLRQHVVYRIEAGDATSATYRLEVSPAPHIAVQRLEYQFPEYTKRPPQVIDGQGDVKALEGTRVTIRAKANHTIRSAHIELGDVMGTEPEDSSTRRLPMEIDAHQAWQTITLKLRADRKTPVHDTYRIHFVTQSGRENEQPIVHRLEVTPDLPPEIEILTPDKEIIEVPEDGVQTLELRAVDPDFGLRSMRLHAVSGGTQLLDDELFHQPEGVSGQTVKRFEFRPNVFHLQSGDRVVYRGTVEDNRWAPDGNSPEPNHARTKDYQLLITPPNNLAGKRPGDVPATKDKQKAAESAEKTPSDGTDQTGVGAGAAEQSGESGDSQQGSGSSKEGTGSSDQQENGDNAGAQGEPSQSDQATDGEQSGDGMPQGGRANGEPASGDPPGRSEPLHDGEVFEKALERLKQQGRQADPGGSGESSGGEPQDESDEQADPKAPGPGTPKEDNNSGVGAQEQATTGAGGKSNKPDLSSGKNGAEADAGDKRQPPAPKDMREKDPRASDDGDSGAGQNSQETTGPGSTGAENRDRPKDMQPDSSTPQEADASGDSQDEKQSDSQGESSGDRSGGGKKGPGQGANQAGNDSPGQNNAADAGAGAANQAGDGETSSAPGDKQNAEGQTGSAGKDKGDGSSSRPGPTGDKTGSGQQPPQPSASGQKDSDSNTEGSTSGQPSGRDGVSTGGGLPSDHDVREASDNPRDVPVGDEANLEYARRATDMVLEYLKDQQDQPDRGLLDELGWTAEELASFVKRWQQLKQSAREDGVGQRELNESLRSLGLRPVRDRARQGKTQSDAMKGLSDDGTRSAPPPAYQELFDAFKKGAARSTQ